MLTSPQNPHIRLARALATQRKARQREGKFIIEGVRLVEEALEADADLAVVFFCPPLLVGASAQGLLSRLRERVECLELSEGACRSLSDTVTPQGLLAIARTPQRRLAEVPVGSDALVMAVENLRDPGNLGTIVRSADGAGAAAVVLLADCVDFTNPKVVRATMGSVFHVPIVEERSVGAFGRWAREQGVAVFGASTRGARPCWDVAYPERTAFLVGSEAQGLSAQAEGICGQMVKIPMRGRAESLNAAMAASVLLYEAIRQRRANGCDGGE